MRKHFQRIVAVVVCLLLMGAFEAFASGSGEQSKGKTEVSFWTYQLGEGARAMLAKFDLKYPGFTLKHSEYSTEDLKTQVRVAVAGGKAPDLFFSNEGFTFWEYVDRGSAMDITDVARELKWAERSYPEYLAADTDKNGRLWGMPWSGIDLWQVLYTNEDFFKAHNLPYPKTVDDMVQLAPRIKAAGMQPISWGNKDGWPCILMIGDFMLQQSDPSIIAKLNNGTLKWTTSDVARKSVEAMVKLAQGGAFVSGYSSQNHEGGIMGWVGGKAAMLYNGSWWPMVNSNTTKTGFKIGTVTFPLISGDTKLSGTQFWASTHVILSAKTKTKEGAVSLMDYFTGFDMQKAQAEDRRSYVVHPAVNQVVQIDPIFKTEPFMKQLELPKMGYFDHAFPIPVIEVMKVQLAKAMAGEVSVDQALVEIETAHAAERGK